jgi:hypothetical protein
VVEHGDIAATVGWLWGATSGAEGSAGHAQADPMGDGFGCARRGGCIAFHLPIEASIFCMLSLLLCKVPRWNALCVGEQTCYVQCYAGAILAFAFHY